MSYGGSSQRHFQIISCNYHNCLGLRNSIVNFFKFLAVEDYFPIHVFLFMKNLSSRPSSKSSLFLDLQWSNSGRQSSLAVP